MTKKGGPQSYTVITIDGPAGSGKSTVAKEVAKRLRYSYLDTGAMYRSLTLKALRDKVNLNDEQQLVALARKTTIDLKSDPQKGIVVFLDGEDVSQAIRTIEVTNNTFYVARPSRVREIMVKWQRALGRKANIVIEGRDVGTVVFPQSSFKFYLDADFEERVNRRFKELKGEGKAVDIGTLRAELKERDNKDMTRKAGPLKKAADAILINTTRLAAQQVADMIIGYIKPHILHCKMSG